MKKVCLIHALQREQADLSFRLPLLIHHKLPLASAAALMRKCQSTVVALERKTNRL